MSAVAERTCEVSRELRAVDEAKRFAEMAANYCDCACRQATATAVAELAENLVRYSGDDTWAGTLAITFLERSIRVRTVNVVRHAEDATRVKRALALICTAGATEVYRDRLRALLDNPDLRRTELGLLRVAFEGGFELSCRFEPPRLMILAERACNTAG